MSVARLDLERLFDHNKREVEKFLETTIRSLLIEKYGAVKGGSKFTEIASMISDALLVDPTRYRNVNEYISALKVYTLGTIFLAKSLDVLPIQKDADKILDFLNKVVKAISISAPNGNILLLYKEISDLIDKEMDKETANKVLLATIFEYMGTILKSISVKALSQPEKELLSKSIASLIKEYKAPFVPLELIYKSFNIPISYKDFVKLLKEISEASKDIILLKVKDKIWATTKEKLEEAMKQIKSLTITLGIVDDSIVNARLPEIPKEIVPSILRKISMLDRDFLFEKRFKIIGKPILKHYPHDPEAYSKRIAEESIMKIREFKKVLKR